jgi:hypothetical protein
MTGFDKKMLHITADKAMTLSIQVDFEGNGSWATYEELPIRGYAHHEFPSGFSAHWVRLVPSAECTASAEFFYS